MPACVCACIRVFTCTFIWTHRYTNHNHACMFASLVFLSLSSFASSVIIYPFGRITSGRRARLPLLERARGLTSSDGAKPIRHLHAHVTCTRLLVSPGEGWEEGGGDRVVREGGVGTGPGTSRAVWLYIIAD